MASQDEPTISIPSLLIVGVIIFFSYRYFFSSRSSSSSSSSTSTSARNNSMRFTAAQVEQIAQMFPQLNRRDIMWDLQRNRGSVAATTERVLGGGRLDPAPPSFQPPTSFTTTSSSPTSTHQPVKHEPDLITRYNLQGRVKSSAKGKEREVEEEPQRPGWSSSKEDRQKMLQRRRDEMILAARRKMMEKDEAL